jgi:hypothetical protein
MTWCEANRVDYLFGLRVIRDIEAILASATTQAA